ncbi:MAG: hypothetical protein L0Y57_03555, partial [Beijerinckiaceae bacterium]|nr:hypothetical protein [Beijerinckiaceae bacterium]
MFTSGAWHSTPVYQRHDLTPGDAVTGPAIIVETTGTNVVEPGWQASVVQGGTLVLKRIEPDSRTGSVPISAGESAGEAPDPVML